MNTPPRPIEPSAEQSVPPGETTSAQSPVVPNSNGATIRAPSLPGGVGWAAPLERIGDFTIVRILGEGGMGTVYLAEDGRLKRKAAIKTMKPELAATPENRERFLREAQAAAAIEHDNVVPIWQVGETTDGSPFIAMPFLQGEMLESRLKREPIQPLGIILKVAREVADGLVAAHAKGLIHRDIKPANVWIEGDPESEDLAQQVRRCKILDFGLARSLRSKGVHLTTSGMIVGTPAYMAPEQACGEKVDHRADLFSLGAMLYRMSTGTMPFEGPSVMAVLTALATVDPPPARTLNPSLPRALSDLIQRLMSKNPNGRPQLAEEVVSAIRRIEPIPVAKPKRIRTPLLVALALLALLPLGWWLGTVILRVESGKGTLVVEIDDAKAEARIKNGKLILTGPDGKVRYTLAPGDRDTKIEAGPYKIRVEGADGLLLDTSEFTLKKGGKITVRVTREPKAVVKNLDPDRTAAEYVLSIGGVVWQNGQNGLNGQNQPIKRAADLPPGAFRLTWVNLMDNTRVTDAGMVAFADCENLMGVALIGTKVSDAGLAYFKDCKNLISLGLSGTQVSDAGLAYFKDCKGLTYLHLQNTQVSDAGLAAFEDCENLTVLNLGGTKVSDAGLAHFEGCKHLTELVLFGTKVGDTGLGHFEGCKSLTFLNLDATQVSDVSLAYFKGCKSLTTIRLYNTKVSDAGLAHFEGCKNLASLDLRQTKVTAAKIEELKKALPKCKIEYDGGVIEPKPK